VGAWWTRGLPALYLGFFFLLVVGIATLFFSPRLGLFLTVAGIGGPLATQVVFTVIAYRKEMRRPWPKVPPIEDDDDDW
jgi:hypothetical protein